MTIDFFADRRKRGLSQEEFAREIDVSVDVVRNLENGGGQPRFENARKVADFYGKTIADLWPLEREAA